MTPKEFVVAYQKHGSVKAVMRNKGLTWHGARKLYVTAVREGLMSKQPVGRKNKEQSKTPEPVIEGQVKARPTRVLPIPEKGTVNRYLFTCAQNQTKLFTPWWKNLLVLANHYNAEVHVSRFTYVKSGLGARGDKAQVTKKEDLYGGRELVWEKELTPYLSDDRIEVAPGLVWCGEMNILPTATRPLSGLESYTGRKSSIFPHVKLAMESIPSGRNEGTKFTYTTGAVTMRNYIQRKAGLKAEFHHCYGALLVEVDSDGDWFCRQINADSEGTIYDLDIRVHNSHLTKGNRVEGITWGDIHTDEMTPNIARLAWGIVGPGEMAFDRSMIDVLRPKYQFMHDVITFMGPSHHVLKDPYTRFRRKVSGHMDVRAELQRGAIFLTAATRPWCKTVCVDSNHHHHIGRWLKEQDGRYDPANVEFWIDMQKRAYEFMRETGGEPNYLLEGMKLAGFPNIDKSIRFLEEDESFILCPDANGGVECGAHGDLGPNGSRGSTRAFTRMGRKMNKGHDHIAAIMDGVYSAATSATLTPDWSRGPGSWSNSAILTYKNAKRAIVTAWNSKWRAEG
jgi:hypothetical protein